MQLQPYRHFYEYLEVRRLGSTVGDRSKKVASVADPFGTPEQIPNWQSSHLPWYLSYALEGRESAADHEGVWLLTVLRIQHHFGDPGRQCWPYKDRSEHLVDKHKLKPRVRLHHYFRVRSAEDCRRVCQQSGAFGFGTFSLGLGVTEEWYDPPHGQILHIRSGSPVLGSHCIGGFQWLPEHKAFRFPNSWGVEWGDNGWGMISSEVIDSSLLEGWAFVGLGKFPPLKEKAGLVVVLWKSSLGGQEVHGREIIDAATSERLGWCFMVRRGNVLEIEELFVWPEYRRRGCGRTLASLARELASQMKVKLSMLVSFVDAEAPNRDALLRISELLELHLHPSQESDIAFVALPERCGVFREAKSPVPPASVLTNLDPASGTRLYTVWYGTNRKPNQQGAPAHGYSGDRDEHTHFGRCTVSIPKSHRFGSIGSKWYMRWMRSSDDRLRIAAHQNLTPDEFWQDIASSFEEFGSDERHALVFLHGYNTSFEDAAIRAAQIGYDLKVPGLTSFFSWPSCGTVLGYPTDESCIEASEQPIADFLCDFVTRSGADRIHLVAHSMGNRGLMRALQRIADRFCKQSKVPFGQIILAAPDVDSAVFKGLAVLFPRFAQRTTLYTSETDLAVGASQWLHSYPRIGLSPPVTVVPGIDTVEIPRFNLFDILGHAYFAEAEGLLHDMFDLIRRSAAPDDRQRLIAAKTPEGLDYWIMNA